MSVQRGNQIGPNTFSGAAMYDSLFHDIVVNSELRDNPLNTIANGYRIVFPYMGVPIYKAELVDVYIPSATDTAVNITPDTNRLYFNYGDNITVNVNGFIVIQAGTYLSPQYLAKEIQREFDIFFKQIYEPNPENYGINVGYNINLNRYIITDKSLDTTMPVRIYKNGDTVPAIGTVIKSIEKNLRLYTNDSELLQSQHILIDSKNTSGLIKPKIAVDGDFGKFSTDGVNVTNIDLEADTYFSNCILSDVVLTNCKIFLSLGPDYCTSNNTLYFGKGANNSNVNTPSGKYIFCQVPTNSPVSSASVKTLLNQPSVFSAVQFYNPLIVNKNTFLVNWYNEYGEPLDNILDHCFTIRFHYYQKSNPGTDLSIGYISNYGS